ncbi:MAG: DUF2163 domain-containing protein [Pseudomonadota bacterium]
MRAVPPALQARLDTGCTTLCRCWQLERQDGVRLGFTDHDRDLTFDGLVHRAASGLTASAATASLGLSIDTQSVEGALQGDAIDDADIEAGRYDGAVIRQFLVDWQSVDIRLLQSVGTLGAITRRGAAFEAEVLGLSAALNQPVGRTFMRRCSQVLGDSRCGVDLDDPSFRGTGVVEAVETPARVRVTGLAAFDAGWFEGGIVSWTEGAAAGLTGAVRYHGLTDGAAVIETWGDLPAGVDAGSAFSIRAGCDKRIETCAGKFGNLSNFRGFPHMPGDDWAAGYPDEGGKHDGGSLFNDR